MMKTAKEIILKNISHRTSVLLLMALTTIIVKTVRFLLNILLQNSAVMSMTI